MHENRHLRAALRARAEAGKQYRAAVEAARGVGRARRIMASRCRSTTAAMLRAPLLVAAEGRNSPTREAAGIRVARWKYDHAAIVSTLRHELPHDQVAYEIFYPAGPFALLPMTDDEGGHRSAIVWSVAAADAPGLLSLERRRLRRRGRGGDGRLPRQDRDDRAALVLSARLPPRRADHRATASRLVGDAAHGIHPIAGQGVNLGFRDAAALAQVLVEGARLGLDLGDRQLLDRYQRWRGLDTFMVALATDSADPHLRRPGQDREPACGASAWG